MHILRTAMLGVVFLALHAAQPAAAQPLADRVPDDALAYFGWAGLDADASGYAESNLAALAEATGITTKFDAILGDLVEAPAGAEPLPPEARELFQQLRDLDGAYLRRPWAIYFGANTGEEKAAIRFLIEPGDGEGDREAITAALTQIQQAAGDADNPEAQVTLETAEDRDVLTLSVNADLLPEDDAPDAALADSDRLATALGDDGAGSLYTVYADLETITTKIREAAPEDAETEAILDRLGLLHLRSLAFTGGFADDGRYASRFMLRSDGEDVMALNLLGGEPITDENLRLTPKSAAWMRAARLDLGGAFEQVMALLEELQPEAASAVEDALARASNELGGDIDLRADLIQGLGDLWVLYADDSLGAAMLGANGGLVAPLNKPDRVAAVLRAVVEYATANMGPQERQRVQLEQRTYEGVDVFALTSAQFDLGVSVTEGRLYLSTAAQAIPTMVANAQADESIVDNEKFQAVREQLGMDDANSLMFVDLEQTAPGYYYGAQTGLGMLSMFAQSPRLNNAIGLIPPLQPILEQLGPAGAASRIDATGWTTRTVSPFPGATLLSPEISTTATPAVTAAGVGIMLPALNASRRTARQLQLSTQARGIHQAMVVWAQGQEPNEDGLRPLPDNIPVLFQDDMLTAEYVLSPFMDTEFPEDFQQWEEQRQNQWLRENSAFVIVPGLVEDLDTETIAVFLKPSHGNGDGITVTYNDNSTQWETDVEAIRHKLKEQTGKTMEQLIRDSESAEPSSQPAG